MAEEISRHTVKVGQHQGRTCITVDGKPIPGIAYFGQLNYKEQPKGEPGPIEGAVANGIHIQLVDGWGTWDGPGKWDFSSYLAKLDQVMAYSPDLWIVPRLYISAPAWWVEANPDECVRYNDGYTAEKTASMASQKWIADSTQMLTALVRAIETSKHGKRILGYSLMCAHGGEWVYWGVGSGRIADYSTPALVYYRDWLTKKYGKQKWIDDAQIPTEAERGRSRPGFMRDPKLDARVIDFDLALSDMVTDNLLAWCRVVKQVTGNRRLTGAFYGYLLWQTGLINGVATNGHLSLRRLLDHPDIDFVTSFPSYDVREPGGAAPILQPVESIQQAGKLLFNECDNRTHLTRTPVYPRFHQVRDQRDPSDGPQLFQGMFNFWPLESPQFSVDVIRREFAHHLIRGSSWWWFDMQGGWFSGSEIAEEFKIQAKIAAQAMDWDMSSVSEVVGIVSGESCAYHSMSRLFDSDPVPSLVELQADLSTREIYKSGVPIDWLMAEDLGRPVLQQYKVLYFHNSTLMSEPQRANLEKLKANGRTMIFIGYPGLVNEGKLDEQAASRAVGMRLKLTDSRAAARFAPRDYNVDCLRETLSQAVLGTGAIVSPRLIVDDPDAQPILHWADGSVAAAMKKMDGWTSYYFPVPPNNVHLFRAICRQAGCHIYGDAIGRNIIYANKSLIAAHTNHYEQTIYLPRPGKLTDLFTGKVVLEHGTSLNLGRGWHWTGGTRLFRMELDEK